MPHPPLTPASFQALARETLGWEHPRIRFWDAGGGAGVCCEYANGAYYVTLTDSDALDLLAAGAFRALLEREDTYICEADYRRGAPECIRVSGREYDLGSEHQVCHAADPANVYKLVCQLHDAGVRDAALGGKL